MGEPAEEWQLGVVGVFVIVGLADAVHESIGIVAGNSLRLKVRRWLIHGDHTAAFACQLGISGFLLAASIVSFRFLPATALVSSKGWLLLPLRIAIVPPSVPRK